MLGSGYSNSASGFATNVGVSTNGGSDTAGLFDAAGNDTFFAYSKNAGKPLAGMHNAAYSYSNMAIGFASNIGHAAHASDRADLYDTTGNATFFSYDSYGGQELSGMHDPAYSYSNMAFGFGTNVGSSTNGSSARADFYDSLGQASFYAYANYNNSGQPLAGMLGNGYSNSASGFATNVATATSGGSSDTAAFFGSGQYYYSANYNNSGQPLAGMYAAGYSNSASGFGANLDNGTASPSDSPAKNTLYTDLAIAQLYGS
jgi:hypothetical protein